LRCSPMAIMKQFEHQVKSIKKFQTCPRGLDFSDPGTGKTRVQIDLFAARRAAGGGCALIIAPKSLLESAWVNDFKKFAPHLTLSVAYANNRAERFNEKADVYITNTDATRWLAKQKRTAFRAFDSIIVDEISYFKHHTSQRSKALKKIVPSFTYRYGLTGTPDANTILDLWHPVYLIDDGERLGKSFFAFRNSVCTSIQVGPKVQMIKWQDKPGAAAAIADILADISVRYTLEECHDIPQNHMYTIPYTLSSKQRVVYNHMQDYALLEVSEGKVINAVNAAALITKLLQISSGAVYDEQSHSVFIEDGRYQLITDLVAARNHSLVFFNWKHQATALKKAFEKAGISYCLFDGNTSAQQRNEYVNEFQQGRYRVCLAHPQTAAHGLTLTRATTTIWASPTYNLEHFLQGNRRIYRAGQKQKTETILIEAKDTIEAEVYAKLRDKDAKQLTFLRILRELSK